MIEMDFESSPSCRLIVGFVVPMQCLWTMVLDVIGVHFICFGNVVFAVLVWTL